MTTEQERVLTAFVESRWVSGGAISRKVGLGSDYADSLCQGLCKDGYLETEGEGRAKVYRLTAKGKETSAKAKAEEAVQKEVKWAELPCAFCRGTGRDPFGVLSHLSKCPVCHGRKTVRVVEPYETCGACEGTGIYFNSRLYCWICKGKGVVPVRQRV